MAKQTVNLSSGPNAPGADNLPTSFTKVNENFDELYPAVADAATAAATAATAAATAATTAATAATTASSAASVAGTASGLASTADTKATQAAAAAAAATATANTANNAASAAGVAATNATTTANNAASSATTAVTTANAAIAIAEDALQVASEAGSGGGGGSPVLSQPRIITGNTTLTSSDVAAGAVVSDAVTNIDLTVPSGLPYGEVKVIQRSVGAVSPKPGLGMTLRGPTSKLMMTSGLYSTLRLTHSDTNEWFASGDLATLTAPTIVPTTFSLDENLPTSTLIGTIGTGGGFPTSFQIVSGNTNNALSLDNAGNLRTTMPLDYESLSSYSLLVRVSNDEGSSEATITFNVNDVLEAPVVQPSQNFFINDDASLGAILGLAVASNAPTSWAITGGTGAGFFSISSTGQITLTSLLDMETAPSYTLTLTATNAISTSPAVTATVNVQFGQTGEPGPTGVVATKTVRGSGLGANTVVSFGHVFPMGYVETGDTLCARITSGGTKIRTQVDVQTRYDDDSVCYAIFAIEVPALTSGQMLPIEIVKNDPHASPGSDISLVTAMSPRTAVALVGGQSINLKNLIPADRVRSGPLISEARIQVNINSADAGGSPGMMLIAYLSVTKDGVLRVDFRLGNIKVFTNQAQKTTCSMTMTLDGSQIYNSGSVAYSRYQCLMRELSSLVGGTAAPARPTIIHNVPELAESGFVANMDYRGGMDPTDIASLKSARQGGSWNTPLNNRGMQKNIGVAGGNTDIGWTTASQAAWLLTGDPELELRAREIGEASGGMPLHMWHETNANPSAASGNWVNRIDQGNRWIDARDNWPVEDGSAGWSIAGKNSHMPDANSVIGALTGRFGLIDNTLAHAGYIILEQWNDVWVRGGTSVANFTNGEGVNMMRFNQMRGMAWCMRTIQNAAWLGSPERAVGDDRFFWDVVDGNLQFLLDKRASWQSESGQPYGYINWHTYENNDGSFPPWQNDYIYVGAIGRIAQNGNPKAREWMGWSKNFNAGRFLQSGNSWNNADAVSYRISIAPSNSKGPYHQTWDAMRADASRMGGTNGPDPSSFSKSQGNYGTYGMAAMAVCKDAFPQEPSYARAWSYMIKQPAVPFSSLAELRRLPDNGTSISIVPKGQTRASVAPTIISGQNYLLNKELPVGSPICVVQSAGGCATDFYFSGASAGETRFSIDDAGVISVAQSLLGEAAETINLTVSCTSRFASGVGSGTIVLGELIVVPDVVSGQVFNTIESLSIGQSAGQIQTVGATPTGFTILSGNTGDVWSVNSPPGQLTLIAELDRATTPTYTLSIRATGAQGNGAPANVTINVLEFVAAPVITTGQVFEFLEEVAEDDVLGTVLATGGPVTTWAITAGNTGGAFAINASTGVLTVATVPTDENYTLTITATNVGGTSTQTVAIAGQLPEIVAPALILNSMPGTNILAAYGTIKMGNYTGALLQARRNDTDTYLDIGPDSAGSLDAAAVLAHSGGTTLSVDKWYDQTGNGRHLIHPSAHSWPVLTDATGNLIALQGASGGRPRIDFKGTGCALRTAINIPTGATANLGVMVVMSPRSHIDNGRIASFYTNDTGDDYDLSNGLYLAFKSSGPSVRNFRGFSEGVSGTVGTTGIVAGAIVSAGERFTRVSDTESAAAASTATVPATVGFRMGYRKQGGYDLSGIFDASAVVIFTTSTLADRNAFADWAQETFGF